MPKEKKKNEYFIKYKYTYIYSGGEVLSDEYTAIIVGKSAKEAVEKKIDKVRSGIRRFEGFKVLDIKKL